MASLVWDDDTDGDVWYARPQSVHGSLASDSSDTDSTRDTDSTISTDDLADYFRMAHGRAFPNFEELPMALPADMKEIQRLRLQYRVAELLVSGTMNPLMIRFLAPLHDGRRKSVLDVRTQAGIWVDHMSVRFPHVDFKTIDVAPTIPHTPRHNLFHEVYDIHSGIIEPDDSFDMVNARHTVMMMKDWRAMLKEIHRVLRPGGILIFAEAELRVIPPGEPESDRLLRTSRLASFVETLRRGMSSIGILTEAYRDIDDWLEPSDPLWEGEPEAGFRDATHWVWELPVGGSWHPDPVMREIGRLMGILTCLLVENSRPLFLLSGVSESDFEAWSQDAYRELRDPHSFLAVRVHLVCACKR